MTSKKDWNQISDSQNDSQLQQAELNQLINPVPMLSKIYSSPLPEKKNTSNQQQNLLKLQNFEGEQVWLFIPLYYKEKQSVEEIDKILKSYDFLIECRKFQKGWNVLTKRENAKQLIINGKRQNKYLIKFYFSSKNDKNDDAPSLYNKRSMQNKTNGEKKRYMLKSPKGRQDQYNKQFKKQYVKPQRKYQQKKIETPKQKKQQILTQKQTVLQNNGVSNKQSTESQSQNLQLKKVQSVSSGNSQSVKKGYKPKYKQKQVTQKANQRSEQVQSPSPKKKNYALKQHVQSLKQQIKKEDKNKQQKSKKQLKIEQKDQIVKQQQQEEQQSQKIVEKSPKKKKKNNKKKELVKDANNPFSMLQSY